MGMLNDLGYSVRHHPKEYVRTTAAKSTYLSAEDLPEPVSSLRPFEGDGGLLFRRSVLLEGFDDARDLHGFGY